MKDEKPSWRRVLPVIGIGLGVFILVGYVFELGGPAGHRLSYLALIASLGSIFGTVLAFDGRSEMAVADMPVLRSAMCAAFGICAAMVVRHWLPQTSLTMWLAIGTAVGAILGWSGWIWAKHVNP
jgi:drug/metabolite transporter (DMT)-like permease